MRVAVNVSAIDLATDSFVQEIDRVLAATSVPPSQLTLEITESALIRTPEAAIATLTALRQRGIRLSVDDYGTGLSSLGISQEAADYEFKIDKSFVTEIVTESGTDHGPLDDRARPQLGMKVVAEGLKIERRLTACARSDAITRKAISSVHRSRRPSYSRSQLRLSSRRRRLMPLHLPGSAGRATKVRIS